MVKVRMNTADVAAEVKCLRRLIGMRCSNVYDLSPKVLPSSVWAFAFARSVFDFVSFRFRLLIVSSKGEKKKFVLPRWGECN